MTSPYLTEPPRSKRQVEIQRLCGNLLADSIYQDSDIKSTRRLLEYALECAKRHAENIPMHEHAYENAEALTGIIDEVLCDYLVPAEKSTEDYFERKEEAS